MRLQDKESYCHRVKGFFEQRVIPTQQFGKLDHIVITLPHFSPVNCDHVIMNPVTNGCLVIANCTLGDLAFMMREQEVHSTSMNIKLCPQVFSGHRRTFNVPSGKSNSPW